MTHHRFRSRRAPKVRREKKGKTPPKGRGLLVSLMLGVGLALALTSWLDRRMTPMLLTLSEARVSNAVTAAVTRRVEDTLASKGVAYSDMVAVEKDSGGRITALTANTAGLNALRGEIITGVLEDVDVLSRSTVLIPVGNLTGIDLFSDLGPSLRVGILATGIASGAFQNEFSAAGVNQTRHRIALTVDVTVSILLPSGPVERVVTVEVPVAETVIVGEVPQQYVSIGTGDT